jgi:hypothetical protein
MLDLNFNDLIDNAMILNFYLIGPNNLMKLNNKLDSWGTLVGSRAQS